MMNLSDSLSKLSFSDSSHKYYSLTDTSKVEKKGKADTDEDQDNNVGDDDT